MRDNVVVSNGTNTIYVNQRSYCELIKWLIVEYAGVPCSEASACVEQHISFFERIDTFEAACLEGHDWPYYYTAMTMFFGEHYKSVQPPPDTAEGLALYQEIEDRILHEHNLKEPLIWISDGNQ